MNRSRISRRTLVGGLLCSTLIVCSAAALAAAPPSKPAAPGRGAPSRERPATPPPAAKPADSGASGADGGMDPKMMEAMEANATPGPNHEWLAGYAGSWTLEVSHWMAPGAPPQTSQAMAVGEMAFGGLFLVERVRGDFGGMPFEGRGTSGYDNIRKEFVFTWIDNMSSGIMTGTGKLSADRKTMTSSTKVMDPATGKEVTMRTVETFDGPDSRRSETFTTGPDGKEFKTMELTYTRRAGDAPGRGGAGGRRGEPGGAGRGGDGGRGGRGAGGQGGTGGGGGGGTGGR